MLALIDSVLIHVSTAAALATTARAALATNSRGTRESGITRLVGGGDLTTALVGLLRHLEDLAELHSLVRLHRLLHVSEPLICHFV